VLGSGFPVALLVGQQLVEQPGPGRRYVALTVDCQIRGDHDQQRGRERRPREDVGRIGDPGSARMRGERVRSGDEQSFALTRVQWEILE
jgi:hypothetical protein